MKRIVPKNAKLVPKEAKRVFKGKIYDVYHWEQEQFDGSRKTFEMLKRPGSVKTFVIKDDKILVTIQEQPGQKTFIDIPGGIHDNLDETELQGAQREVFEETGLKLKNWKLIDVTQFHSKIEHLVYLFVAWDIESEESPELDAGEKIEVKFMTMNEFKELENDPRARHFQKEIIDQVETVEDLISFPEFEGVEIDV